MKKYISEILGTMTLVFFGCGTAVVIGGLTGGLESGLLGVLPIALAFGLSIWAAAYAIGDISGAHLNPAVSTAMLLQKKLSITEYLFYVISQIVGAMIGSSILYFITSQSNLSGTGANGYGKLSSVNLSLTGAFVTEVVLTAIFLLVILGVTRTEKTSSIAGIVIGATLTMVHIIGIPLTGTSVNPARSLSAAVFAGGDALSQVWVFILAPLVGAIIASLIFSFLYKK